MRPVGAGWAPLAIQDAGPAQRVCGPGQSGKQKVLGQRTKLVVTSRLLRSLVGGTGHADFMGVRGQYSVHSGKYTWVRTQ